MRVLILEDEPLIALDLEDAVLQSVAAEIVFASTLAEAQPALDGGIDFALLDIRLRDDSETSLPMAGELMRRRIPFCFVSSAVDDLPGRFADIPKIRKPFRHSEVCDMVASNLH